MEYLCEAFLFYKVYRYDIKGKDTYYIQVAYSIAEPEKKEQEISSFYKIDDGYKKIVITMDNNPFSILENGYKKMQVFDFLLNENALEEC